MSTRTNPFSWSALLLREELQTYVNACQKAPGTLSYSPSSSSGISNTSHFIRELLDREMKIDLQHIPYPGENPAVTAVLEKHAQIGFVSLPGSLQYIRSGGAVMAVAVFATKRDPELPQVPIAEEEGLPNLVTPSYHIFYVPARTPAPILKKLETTLDKGLQDKNGRNKIEALGRTVAYLNSQDTKKFLDYEYRV